MHRNTFEVQSLLNEVLELFEAPARQRSISLTCHAPQAVPCVIGERDRLLRVLSNLVGNAVKFTPPCGRISVHARLLEEALYFSVEDTGPGIPSESLPQLFDRFWQADRTGRVGIGLGAADREGDRGSTRGSYLGRERPGSRDDVSFYGPLCNASLSALRR